MYHRSIYFYVRFLIFACIGKPDIHQYVNLLPFNALVSFIRISEYKHLLQVESGRLFDEFQNNSYSYNTERKTKIVIWLNPRFSKSSMKYRREFVVEKMITPQNTGNVCFSTKLNCEMTLENDENALREADAILFIEFARYFNMDDLPPNWQKWRRPEQIWAIQIDESPINHPSTILEVFNWTLSYRQDSDIWLPYGKTVLKTAPNFNEEIRVGLNNDIPLSQLFKGKSKLVTGVISNCHTNSKRELVLKEMMKTNKSVDIYGGCGNVKNVTEKCGFYGGECTRYWNNLARKYSFYLAFENSLCVDYVTEKFWRTLRLGMVPVVYGGANYRKLAPPGSYIDLSWFKSAKELMEYLERVAGSEEEYSRFFEWMRHYEVREEATRYMTAETGIWCEFCKKLKDIKKGGVGFSGQTVPGDWWSRLPNSNDKPCMSYDKILGWKL